MQEEVQMNETQKEETIDPKPLKTNFLSNPWFLRCIILICVILFTALVWRLMSQHNSADLLNIRQLRFQTGEDAVRHFFNGISKGDAKTVLEACNGRQNDIFEQELGRYNNPDNYSTPDWTVSYAMYQSFDDLFSLSNITYQLKGFITSLLLPWQDYKKYSQEDPAGTVSRLNPYFLKNLKFVKLIDSTSLATSDMDKKLLNQSYERLKSDYQAEDVSKSLAVFSLDKQYYSIGFTLVKKEGSWKIQSFTTVNPADILGITNAGLYSEPYRAKPLTQDDYRKILDTLDE